MQLKVSTNSGYLQPLGKACLLQANNVAISGDSRALGGLVGESPKDVLGDSPGGTSTIITN